MHRTSEVLLVIVFASLVIVTGCGGGETTDGSSLVSAAQSSTSNTAVPSAYVVIKPAGVTLGAGQTLKFTAAMSDSTAATFTWSVGDCSENCGTLTAEGLYSAPSFVSKVTTLTVRATSQAKGGTTGSVYLNLMPVTVKVSPAAFARLSVNAARPFAASVTYDPVGQGVTWSLSGAGCSGNGCGTLMQATSTSVVYHAPDVAPNPPTITLKATSVTDPNQSSAAGLMVMGSDSQHNLQGAYAFLVQGKRSPNWEDPTDYGGDMAIAGHMEVDTNGKVSGVWDATLKASGGATEPIFGNYTVESDGIGTLTLHASSGTWTFALAVQAGGDSAVLCQSSSSVPPVAAISIQSGYLLRQDKNAFSMTSVKGDHVVALTFMNVGALGRFTSDEGGNISNGQMDLTWQGGSIRFFTTGNVTGAFTPPDVLSGRGTAVLTVNPGPDSSPETFHFAYYAVSDKKMLLVQTDANTWQLPVLRGEARRQNGAGTFNNASWNAPVIYNLTSDDAGSWFTPFATIGAIRPDGAGSLVETSDNSEIVEDVGTVISQKVLGSGTYSVSPNGRVELSLPGISLNLYHPHIGVAYLTGANEGYLIREQIFGTPFGYFEPQTAVSFSEVGIAGVYSASVAGPPRTFKAKQEIGLVTLGIDGTAAVFLGVDGGAGFELLEWTGTYTVEDDGRGVLNLTDTIGGQPKQIVFWALSGNHLLAVVSMTSNDSYPTLVELYH